MTEYYYAKEREESTVERINDSYLEALNSLEKLEAENAKMRELVGIMRTCIEHACMCDFCPLFAAEDMDEIRCIADMDSRMRELGVEVDG